jgi:hypothetical protein
MKLTSAHAIAFLALVIAVGGGYAVAHNGDTDKIHLCVNNGTGAVRAVQPEASCDPGETPNDVRIQQAAYQSGNAAPNTFGAKKGYRLISRQMVLPGAGESYALSGKAVLSKASSATTRSGLITCEMIGTDEGDANDVVKVTVAPGESEVVSFQLSGHSSGRPGQTVTTEIACKSPASRFTASNVQVTAIPVDTVSKGVDVPTTTP